MALKITSTISLDENELLESFVRSGGAGGQNVNKVATAVQLRFDVKGSPNLPNRVRERLLNQADQRLTKDGVLVIFSARHRTQDMNRREVRERLIKLIRRASEVPKRRIATKPSRGSKTRRLDRKNRHSALKKNRSKKIDLD